MSVLALQTISSRGTMPTCKGRKAVNPSLKISISRLVDLTLAHNWMGTAGLSRSATDQGKGSCHSATPFKRMIRMILVRSKESQESKKSKTLSRFESVARFWEYAHSVCTCASAQFAIYMLACTFDYSHQYHVSRLLELRGVVGIYTYQ